MNEYTLNLNDKDLQIINDALIEMPFKIVAPLIGKINEQLKTTKDNVN